MTTSLMQPVEGRALLAGETVISTASVIWWTALLWAHRNVLYVLPAAAALIAAVLLSLVLTWVRWQRHRWLAGADLLLVLVRGVAAMTLSLAVAGGL
ncbi:hypothetical protein [Streptomyces sp. NPDC047000]|uniref:hypothetical protein n=1 Tax=Streptomyces sp. NPDC047000 TaxID=3155474 RepID=UPI003406D328